MGRALFIVVAMLAASPSWARAPQPTQGVAASMYSGRWYQIAHIVKNESHPCLGGVYSFEQAAPGTIALELTCHDRTAEGPPHVTRVKGTIEPGSGNAKFKVRFFGGLFSQEYWVLDHAADLSWALMATPGGNYLWLLSRRQALPAATMATVKNRVHALGYDTARLVAAR